MSETNVRLEVLKLAHAHGRTAEEVLVRASAYEGYVLGDQKSKSEATKIDSRKREEVGSQKTSGNPVASNQGRTDSGKDRGSP